jgi:hypothetical protein
VSQRHFYKMPMFRPGDLPDPGALPGGCASTKGHLPAPLRLKDETIKESRSMDNEHDNDHLNLFYSYGAHANENNMTRALMIVLRNLSPVHQRIFVDRFLPPGTPSNLLGGREFDSGAAGVRSAGGRRPAAPRAWPHHRNY